MQPATIIHNYPQPPTTINNHSQPSTSTHNHPEPPTNPQNHPQPHKKLPKTTHNHPQPPKNYPKKPKLVTNSYVTALYILILKQTLTLIVILNNDIYTCVCLCLYTLQLTMFTIHYLAWLFVFVSIKIIHLMLRAMIFVS